MNTPQNPNRPPSLPDERADAPHRGPPNAADSSESDDGWTPPIATRVAPHPETLKRIGDYTILGILGEGGMGTVYLGEDVRIGRQAAIKTIKPELAANPDNRERFLREAKAAAAVEHDNIVPI